MREDLVDLNVYVNLLQVHGLSEENRTLINSLINQELSKLQNRTQTSANGDNREEKA